MMETVFRRMIALMAISHGFLPMSVVNAQTPTLDPTRAPTIPTLSPTLEANWTAPECYNTTTLLYQAMLRANSFIPSVYVICPNTVISIGIPDADDVCCIDGDLAIFPRSRSTIMCGEDGKSTNNCTFTGGNTQIFFLGSYYGDAITAEVKFMGLTFENADFTSVALAGRGDFTFTDCVWTNHFRASGIVFLAYSAGDQPEDRRRALAEAELLAIEDPMERAKRAMSRDFIKTFMQGAWEESQKVLTAGGQSPVRPEGERELQAAFLMPVTFVDCEFRDNIQGPTDIAGIALFGIISILTPFIPVKVQSTDFRRNTFDGSDGNQNGFAIQAVGGELEVTNCCFEGNSFIGFGPVQAFGGAPFTYSNNFCTEDDLIFCEFGAFTDSFVPNSQDDVECIFFDLETCRGGPRETWPAPTAAPDSSAHSWFISARLIALLWIPVWLLLQV